MVGGGLKREGPNVVGGAPNWMSHWELGVGSGSLRPAMAAVGWEKPPVFDSLGPATKLCLCVVGGVVVWSREEGRR